MTQLSLLPLCPPARPETPVTQELSRRSRNAQRVLERLRIGPATTRELVDVGGLRAPGRVHELRQQGYEIAVDHKAGGLFVYTLVREP